MTAGSSCRGRETCYGEDGTGAYSERASTHPMQTAHSRLMHSSRRLLTVIASHHKQAAAPEWRHRGRMLIARQRLALRPLRHLSPRRQRRELRSGAQHFRSCWGQEGGPAARGGVRRASALEDMTAPSHFPLTRRRAEAPLPPVERNTPAAPGGASPSPAPSCCMDSTLSSMEYQSGCSSSTLRTYSRIASMPFICPRCRQLSHLAMSSALPQPQPPGFGALQGPRLACCSRA